MKSDSQTPSGLTRRSFIKKSVVASVAVSSVTIFSGLVRAEVESPSAIQQPSPKSCVIRTATGDTYEIKDEEGNVEKILREYACYCGRKGKLRWCGWTIDANGGWETVYVECPDALGAEPPEIYCFMGPGLSEFSPP